MITYDYQATGYDDYPQVFYCFSIQKHHWDWDRAGFCQTQKVNSQSLCAAAER